MVENSSYMVSVYAAIVTPFISALYAYSLFYGYVGLSKKEAWYKAKHSLMGGIVVFWPIAVILYCVRP